MSLSLRVLSETGSSSILMGATSLRLRSHQTFMTATSKALNTLAAGGTRGFSDGYRVLGSAVWGGEVDNIGVILG